MFLFFHAGKIGDCTYSLWYCRQRSNYEPFDFHLQTNVHDAHDPGKRPVFLTNEDAEYLASILREQSYIRNLTIGDGEGIPAPDVTRVINLNLFRQAPFMYGLEEIRNWCYKLSSIKPENLDKPVLTVPESDIAPIDKVLLCITPRYQPAIPIEALKPYKDHLAYVGLGSEYDRFCRHYFPVEYQPVSSAKELLQKAKKSKGFIGNISGQYSFMEAAAIPRILMLPPKGGDVRPYTPNGVAVMEPHKMRSQLESLLGA